MLRNVFNCLFISVSIAFFISCETEIKDNIDPSCFIVSPVDGGVVKQGVKTVIIANASDLDGTITSVSFCINNIEVGISKEAPYSYNWENYNQELGNYTIKAVATDNSGVSFIHEIEVSLITSQFEYGQLIDIEGNNYKSVKIGSSWWMAENLKVTKEVDGTPLPKKTTYEAWNLLEDNDTDKAYTFYNNNENLELNTYGALYNYAAAKNACPTGWHLPTNAEYEELIQKLAEAGFQNREVVGLKAAYSWADYHQGYNAIGFDALGAGESSKIWGLYRGLDWETGFWTGIDSEDDTRAYAFWFWSTNKTIDKVQIPKHVGYSVRCVKD